jgi:hypothetical protein
MCRSSQQLFFPNANLFVALGRRRVDKTVCHILRSVTRAITANCICSTDAVFSTEFNTSGIEIDQSAGSFYGAGKSRCSSLGQYEIRGLSLSGDSLVRRYQVGFLHETIGSQTERLSTRLSSALPVNSFPNCKFCRDLKPLFQGIDNLDSP